MSAKLANVLVKIKARVCPAADMLLETKEAAIMPCNKEAMIPLKWKYSAIKKEEYAQVKNTMTFKIIKIIKIDVNALSKCS